MIHNISSNGFVNSSSLNGTTVEAWEGTWSNTNGHQWWLFEQIKSPMDEMIDAAEGFVKLMARNFSSAVSGAQGKLNAAHII